MVFGVGVLNSKKMLLKHFRQPIITDTTRIGDQEPDASGPA